MTGAVDELLMFQYTRTEMSPNCDKTAPRCGGWWYEGNDSTSMHTWGTVSKKNLVVIRCTDGDRPEANIQVGEGLGYAVFRNLSRLKK